MACFRREDDDLVSCPYNPCHKMRKCHRQAHIKNCQQRNEGEVKEICPFNAQHHVPKPELFHHLQTCPNRDVLDLQITSHSEQKMDIPPSSNVESITENWDNEILPYAAPAYDPKLSQKKILFKDTSGMLPSERKLYYKSLHNSNGELSSEPEKENYVESEWTLKELRQPKVKPEVMKFRPLDVQSSSLGLGRGLPSSNRRIAANIFGPLKSQEDNEEPNHLGRGIGRGFLTNQE